MTEVGTCESALSFIDTPRSRQLRLTVQRIVESSTSQLDLAQAVSVTEAITTNGPPASWAVLGAIYERLFRRTGLYKALELLEFCVRNCGLDFAQYIRRPFLRAMTRLLKLTSLKEQTLAGQLNSTVKLLVGAAKGSKTPGIQDVRDVLLIVSRGGNGQHCLDVVQRCQRKVLYLIQLWADAFMMHEERVPDIVKTYRDLRRKGYTFPARDPQQRYLIKHAETSPAFDAGNITSHSASAATTLRKRPSSSSSSGAGLVINRDPPSSPPRNVPATPSLSTFTELHCSQLRRSLAIMRAAQDSSTRQRCATLCQPLYRRLVHHIDRLMNQPGDIDDDHVSALLDLQTEVEHALASLNASHITTEEPAGVSSPQHQKNNTERGAALPPQQSKAVQLRDPLPTLASQPLPKLPPAPKPLYSRVATERTGNRSKAVDLLDQPSSDEDNASRGTHGSSASLSTTHQTTDTIVDLSSQPVSSGRTAQHDVSDAAVVSSDVDTTRSAPVVSSSSSSSRPTPPLFQPSQPFEEMLKDVF